MASLTPTTSGASPRRAGATPAAGASARRVLALDPRTRARLEALADRIIALLDACDGDPDMEQDLDVEDDAEASAQPPTLDRDWRGTNVIALPRRLRRLVVTA